MRASLVASLVLVLWGQLAHATPARFSHEQHVVEEKARCPQCHVEKSTGLPALKRAACESCHDDVPSYRSQRAPRLGMPFAHARHAKTLPCLECHASILKPASKTPAPLVSRSDCLTCHTRRRVVLPEANCKTCHGKDQRRVKPANHIASWLKRHGPISKAQALPQHGTQCQLCHRNDTCTSCHRKRPPANHTGLWRMRLHGAAAAWERESCKTCHQTGTCVRCHRTTRPLNHRGAWYATHGLAAGGASLSSSAGCRTCHSAGSCIACHRRGK